MTLLRCLLFFFHLFFGILLASLLSVMLGKHWYVCDFGARIRMRWMAALASILGLRIRQHGRPALRGTLLVANHISWLDIVCIGASQPVVFVAKTSVSHWPVIGLLAKLGGTLFLAREQKKDLVRISSEINALIQRGANVLFFPEGTTTDGTEIKSFQSSLFQTAIDQGCAVQPVALQYNSRHNITYPAPFIGDDNFVSHLLRVIAHHRAFADLSYCPPFIPWPSCTRRSLAEHARQQILQRLAAQSHVSTNTVESDKSAQYNHA